MENKVTTDYLDEEGCLHCGICGKRKQMKVSLMGFEHVVSCLCECEVKARQELDEKPYMSEDPWMNIPLTATEALTMESRPKQPKYARNKNIVVIGGSGSGKTRFFVKPSVMQMNCSMVITDPKGTLIEECGKMLAKGPPKKDKNGNIMKDKSGKVVHEPYVIKVLNTINFSKSLHYNPFAYIRSEKDILKLVTTIIVNTKGDKW